MSKDKFIKNSILTPERLCHMVKLMTDVQSLDGDAAEVGVLQGGSALRIADTLQDRRLALFDTFEGLTEDIVDPTKDRQIVGAFSTDKFQEHQSGFHATLEYVQGLFVDYPNVSVYKGVFPKENSDAIADWRFAFVHLDCDTYYSVKSSLEFFYPRMVKGGIILLDDFGCPWCPGANLATNEFLADKPEITKAGVASQASITIQ
jgi:hypothetical protein